MHIVNVEAAKALFRISLNGIPLMDIDAAAPVRAAERLDPWAVNGKNRLVVDAGPLVPGPAAPDAFVRVSVRHSARGADPEAADTLVTLSWPDPASPAMPARLEENLALAGLPEWTWAGASPVAPSAAEAGRIGQVVATYVGCLERKDVPGAVDALDLLLTEHAQATGLPPSDMKARFADFLTERMADRDWRVEPLDEADLSLTPVAGGRLIVAQRKDGQPAVSTESGLGGYSMTPMLTRIGNDWQIAR